jgi:antitoxin component of RelBE/YafQ-DinJ toxin-antitoxin module
MPLSSTELANKETAKAIEEARKGEGRVVCKNMDDFFDTLDNDA